MSYNTKRWHTWSDPDQATTKSGRRRWITSRWRSRTKRAQSANEINIIEPNKATIRKELEHLKDYINADPYERVGMRPPSLVTASGRPKKRPGKKKNGGLEAILEHHDINNDPYYTKPPLPTQMK